MTQKDKDLLLKDLSSRLPYGVKFKIGDYSDYKFIGIVISDEHPIKVEVIEKGVPYKIEVSLDIIKPYLRPMSSMTEEEESEYHSLCYPEWCAGRYDYHNTLSSIEWLLEHHFDFRGMIEKGMAIEVTENNNPYKE